MKPEAERVRNLVMQLGLSRADAAALLREIAADLDRTPLDGDAHLRAVVERWAAALSAQGITVTTGLQVRTHGAALVVGRQAKTLRNWRSSGVGPHWHNDHGVVLYDLVALVQWRKVSRTVPVVAPAELPA